MESFTFPVRCIHDGLLLIENYCWNYTLEIKKIDRKIRNNIHSHENLERNVTTNIHSPGFYLILKHLIRKHCVACTTRIKISTKHGSMRDDLLSSFSPNSKLLGHTLLADEKLIIYYSNS